MTTTPVSRLAIALYLEIRVKSLAGVTHYRGGVIGEPPLIVADDDAVDAARRVAPYVVQHSGTGSHDINGERDVAGIHQDLSGVHQFTCVAGYEDDCLNLVDRVDALFNGHCPVIPGLGLGRLRPPAGFDPGTVRCDETPKSGAGPRFWVPLQYRLDATT